MSCCAAATSAVLTAGTAARREELRLASRPLGGGLRQSDLSVPGMHCASCIQAVESALKALDAVEQARVNLSTRRVSVTWRGQEAPPLIETLEEAGYPAHVFDGQVAGEDKELQHLIRALAVAGFGAMNIMLLSVSIWAGADAETRQSFHLLSAFIALPVLAYSGQVFFRSAWSALRAGRTNMDVPISIGVSLAFGLSFYDTLNQGEYAYFDASVSLLFFLLIGRTLDHVMREKARVAVHGLMRLSPRGAMAVAKGGDLSYLPIEEIEPGQRLRILPGDRFPVDVRLLEGESDIDGSIATGETAPLAVARGAAVKAGMRNLTGALTVEATARAADSFLSEMLRLMEVAEGGQSRYRRLADRAASIYSPLVHSAALLAFAGWYLAAGDGHQAITIAISVLIITCPCALGLAVPMVQVVAARRLFEKGILVKDGGALERLASVDTVVFDKTGTLTQGRPDLVNQAEIGAEELDVAAGMAANSHHPYARAIVEAAAAAGRPAVALQDTKEVPGKGLEVLSGGERFRLGRADWAVAAKAEGSAEGTVLSRQGHPLAHFTFRDRLRPGAKDALAALRDQGMMLRILSGDRAEEVAAVADRLGVAEREAAVLPGDKVASIEKLRQAGHRVLMVGDGLNDAPALAAADVSMAPASAADIGRNAAGFVFLQENLLAVPSALAVVRRAAVLVRQNFILAIAYNALALPLAIFGYVTPLVAALAMSLSSILVVSNALRLGGRGWSFAGSLRLSRKPGLAGGLRTEGGTR